MSEDQLSAFLEVVKGNPDLQRKLAELSEPSALVALAKEAGFTIDLQSVDELYNSEISEKELESVAGGGTRCVTRSPFKSIIKMVN